MTCQAGAYLRFLWHEATRSISTPPWMGCQSIAGLPPSLNLPVPIYTPGWREALWELSVLQEHPKSLPYLQPAMSPASHAQPQPKHPSHRAKNERERTVGENIKTLQKLIRMPQTLSTVKLRPHVTARISNSNNNRRPRTRPPTATQTLTTGNATAHH